MWKKVKPMMAGSTVKEQFIEEFDDWCEDVGGRSFVGDGKYAKTLTCSTETDSITVKRNPAAWSIDINGEKEYVSGSIMYKREDDKMSFRGNHPRNNTISKFVSVDQNLDFSGGQNKKKPDPRRHS